MATSPASFSSAFSEPADTCVADMLLRVAAHHPTSGLYLASGDQTRDAEFMSYPALVREAQGILGALQRRVTGSNAKIALLLESPRHFIPAFWACVLGGYIPCPLAPIRSDPNRWASHLEHVDKLLERPLFVSAGSLLRELDSVTRADIADLRSHAPQESVHRARSDDPAILMLTSGSTGHSKAVELTHGNLLASMAARAERQQLTCADLAFNWIAFDHVAALLESHMIALYVGATQLHVEPAAVLADPLQFLRLIDRHRVSLAFAPNFLLGQINAALQSPHAAAFEGRSFTLDLSCLRRIVTGGEANVVDTGRSFLELLAPYGLARDALWPAFGMTETCAASVYSHEFPDCDDNHEFAAVGLPLAGLEVRIVDEDLQACPTGQAGELQVRGPMIFGRYYNNEEATHSAFTDDGWFRTGDVGRLDDGRLCLVARNKDSIIVNGVNYYSHELETKLEQLDGVERSFVAAFPTRPKGADTEQLVVTFATTIPPQDEEGLYQLLVAIRNTTIMLWGFRPARILILAKGAFPKTSLGKIQRSLMRKRFEAGNYSHEVERVETLTLKQAGPYLAPEGALELAVAEIFARILGVSPSELSATASFFDMGGTSLDILKLTRTLERRLGFKVGLPLVLQNPSVRQLSLHMASGEERSKKQYDPIVPLQVTGRKTPLFCVHPGNGEIFVLTNVAKYFLNDRPFYALRPPGFNEGEECFKSVEEMVDAYVDAILKRQPTGPYAIAGYSIGCQIAFEIAKKLEAAGREVGFLGGIDYWPRSEPVPLDFNMATGLALVIDLITMAQFEELNKKVRPELPSDEVCDYVLKFAASDRLTELDLDINRFAVWSRVAHCMEVMMYAHEARGSVRSMTIFCGEGVSPSYTSTEWSRQSWRNELERWDRFVMQPKYVEVPGHHHGLMGPKYVAAFQSILRSEIDLAMQKR